MDERVDLTDATSAVRARVPVLAVLTGENEALEVQRGALEALLDSGTALALVLVNHGMPQVVTRTREAIERLRPTGLLLAPAAASSLEMVSICRDSGSPFVTISPDACEDGTRLVCSNDRQAAQDATAYLHALGHTRIGFVAGSDSCRSSRERELGYLDCLAEHRLDLGAELATTSDGSLESGLNVGRLLLQVSPHPTAILACSDAMAAGVLRAAHELGVAVPRQLSVIGFGDTPLAEACWPPLTTMRLPLAEMAFTAAIKLIDPARADAQPVEFFCELIPRGSTGPVSG